MDRSRVGNKESSRVGSEAAATEERRSTVTHFGCQSAAAKDDVRGQPGTEYGTVAEIPGEVHVIQKAQNGRLSKVAIGIDIGGTGTKIIELQVERVQEMLRERGVSLKLTQAAKTLLIEEGYDPQYGARPMRRWA